MADRIGEMDGIEEVRSPDSNSKEPPKFRLVWVKSPWTRRDLEGKTVEFRISSDQYGRIEGYGKFMVSENNQKEIGVAIIVNQPGRTSDERIEHRFALNEEGVKAIKANPPGSTFEFSCFAF